MLRCYSKQGLANVSDAFSASNRFQACQVDMSPDHHKCICTRQCWSCYLQTKVVVVMLSRACSCCLTHLRRYLQGLPHVRSVPERLHLQVTCKAHLPSSLSISSYLTSFAKVSRWLSCRTCMASRAGQISGQTISCN